MIIMEMNSARNHKTDREGGVNRQPKSQTTFYGREIIGGGIIGERQKAETEFCEAKNEVKNELELS